MMVGCEGKRGGLNTIMGSHHISIAQGSLDRSRVRGGDGVGVGLVGGVWAH